MRTLGIIPARKGSKSIPNKNLALLAGKHLIEYTLEAAKAAETLFRVVVSTDCPQVAEVARQHGVEVIERPERLAQDDTPMIPVLQHALSVCGEPFDAVSLLQPTCPLRRAQDIDGACLAMIVNNASSVISYVDVGANHPARMVFLLKSGFPYPVLDTDCRFANKQDLPAAYIRSGDIYLVRSDVLLGGDLVGDKPRAYIIPQERWLNVDCQRDLDWAEFLLRREASLVGIG